MPRTHRNLTIVLFCCCVLIWGSSFILIKRGVAVFSPFQVGALRLLVAGLSLLPFAIGFLRRSGFRAYNWKLLLLSALTGSILPGILFPLAQTQVASATTGALNALTPLFTLFIGAVLFSQPVSRLQVLGILVGLAGSVSLVLDQPFETLTANLGYGAFAVAASLLYGVNLNLIKRYLSHLKPLELTSLGMFQVIVPALVYLFALSDFTQRLVAVPGAWQGVGYVAILGFAGTALALILFYRLVQLGGPVLAASNTYFIPFVALLWGLADGEPLGVLHLVGLATVLLGVFLVSKGSRRAPIRQLWPGSKKTERTAA